MAVLRFHDEWSLKVAKPQMNVINDGQFYATSANKSHAAT
jgi:hypothetical protein